MHRPPDPNRSPSARRAVAGITFLLALAACGGGGGGGSAPATPAPSRALVWGSGTWGTSQWSATASPVRIDPAPVPAASPIPAHTDLTQEISR